MFRVSGLARLPARLDNFWAARTCPKPELQSPKARRTFSSHARIQIRPNFGRILGKNKIFLGQIFFFKIWALASAEIRPNFGRKSGKNENNFFFKNIWELFPCNLGRFHTLEKSGSIQVCPGPSKKTQKEKKEVKELP